MNYILKQEQKPRNNSAFEYLISSGVHIESNPKRSDLAQWSIL